MHAGPRTRDRGDSSNSRAEESESRMHKPIKYVEKAVTVAATGAWAVFERLNRIAPNEVADSEVVRQAPAQVLGKVEAAARLAAHDRFALSRSACLKFASRSSTATCRSTF